MKKSKQYVLKIVPRENYVDAIISVVNELPFNH